MIVHMPEPFRYEVLGQTLDDAAGEAFDKVARLIGLGFPGGPALDKMARDGNPDAIRFPRSMERSGDFDFSMSGLKTAVLRHVKAERAAGRDIDLPDLAASFQEAIVDVQVAKTIEAARQLRGRHRAAGRRRRGEHPPARTDGARRERGGTPRAVPAARALHGQRGDDRVRGSGQTRSRGTHVARHRSRSELRVSVVTTVLVTGGAGFIGSHLADRLLAEGYRVISVDDLTTGRIANLAEGRNYGKEFTFFNMDVRSDGVQQLFERHRPEIVFHLAAQSGVRPSLEDPSRDASINVMGALNILEHAAKAGVRKVIYAASGARSTASPNACPRRSPARRAATPRRRTASRRRWCVDYLGFFQRYRGLDFTALALGNVYGPRQDPHGEAGVIAIFAAKMLAGETPTIYGDGNQTRDYVFIDDTVHAFVQAMEKGSGKLVNIGTGLEASVNHIYQLLAGIIGFTAEPGHGPLPPGELRRIALDISSAPNAIGWKPWTHLEDGLAETVAFLKGI